MAENQNDQTIVRRCGAFSASAWLVPNSETPAKDALPSLTPKTGVGEVQSEKIHYGPRQKGGEYYDGREPLEHPGHEAAAWFQAFPEGMREFKSIAALARHFRVARMTIYRWSKDIDVLKRADFLSMQNKIAGILIARREYPSMVEIGVETAKAGNIAAMKIFLELAFPEDKQANKSGISSSSLEEVLERSRIDHIKHADLMTPTFLRERAKRLGYGMPRPKEIDVPAKSEPEAAAPTPAEPAPVNACTACGKTRCVHGRCPMCDNCAECK
jgi:hypothetical protein